MVNALAVMHTPKGKQIDFTQAFPQAKLGYYKNKEWALKLKRTYMD
jgi:hypothetical protein